MVRELLSVVMRAALQWALASLLLANGAAFCLIAAAAACLRLGPPCLLCAGVHRLLCSSSAPSQESAAFRCLLCDAHVAAIAAAAAAPEQEQKTSCSASDHIDSAKRAGAEAENSDKTGGNQNYCFPSSACNEQSLNFQSDSDKFCLRIQSDSGQC
ncbi:hypothetical protein ABZP36_012554 [Zizania latifolia]